ncbi:MAG: hypothetical protein Q7R35_15960, partial [Elusimicrobiota bacterium]|nr:hypothetical protein [Elusimicrobiota bacterium]
MKKAMQLTILLSSICLLSLDVPAKQSQNAQDTNTTAEYWQASRGVMSTAYTYSIVLETPDPEQVETKILKLGEEIGVVTTSSRYRNNEKRQIGFKGTLEKAEALSQKVAVFGKLTGYSTYSSRDEKQYNEMKKKAELIKTELEKNKKLFAHLPIATTIMTDL